MKVKITNSFYSSWTLLLASLQTFLHKHFPMILMNWVQPFWDLFWTLLVITSLDLKSLKGQNYTIILRGECIQLLKPTVMLKPLKNKTTEQGINANNDTMRIVIVHCRKPTSSFSKQQYCWRTALALQVY